MRVAPAHGRVRSPPKRDGGSSHGRCGGRWGLTDLRREDSGVANILGFVIKDAEKLIDAYGLDEATGRAIHELIEQVVETGLPSHTPLVR